MSQVQSSEQNEMLQAEAARFKDDMSRVRDEVGKVMVGQKRVIETTLTAMAPIF